MSKEGYKVVIENRKARHNYHIEETYEAGLCLVGTEVKSLREGKGNIQDAYAEVKDGEVWVNNFHISPYEKGNRFNHEPKRPKKLLLHRREINRLYGLVQKKVIRSSLCEYISKTEKLRWPWRWPAARRCTTNVRTW